MSSPSIDKSELIGRGIFSSRQANEAKNNNRVLPTVFLERIGVDKISVDRLCCASLSVFVQIGDEIAKNRSNGKRSFYGWAVLTVQEAECSDRKVESTPIENNPYHADICLMDLPSDDDELKLAQNRHAVALAAKSEWLDKETGSTF